MISVPRLPPHQQHSTTTQQQYNGHQHHHNYNLDSQATTYPFDFSSYNSSPVELPRSDFDDSLAIFSHDSDDHSDLMQSDSWAGPVAQYPPRLGRISHHQRDSSLSSMGSNGPASPFTHNTSNPQIAVTDSAHEGLADHNNAGFVNGPNGQNGYYHLAKSLTPYSGFGGLENGMPDMAYPVTISGPRSKPRVDRGLLPAPEFPSNRSHPASVASSIAGDSPATPTVGYGTVPKLDRTMTDVYSDELYNPNFAITSSSSSQPQMAVSSNNDLFSQRLQAANSQHLSAHHSPASSVSRDRSPFRTGSPLAPSPSHDFGTHPMGNVHFNSAQRMREQQPAQQEVQMMSQQMSQRHEPETPKTISPKDAILEFNEPEEGNFPLFPSHDGGFEVDNFSKAMVGHGSHNQHHMNDGSANHFSYIPSQVPTGISVPQQYPFIAQTRQNHDTPPRLSSTGSSSADSGHNTPVHSMRPAGASADGGTYTCTYHGCTLRFETPALLQKHKREGHRQAQTINGPRNTAVIGSQAGPHRCNRINPSTGKQCNTIFSRPYDLTRHEDTIHNARKQKVRCHLCQEEKTFSRADALTRHFRVCHPDMPLPGKHRRRAA